MTTNERTDTIHHSPNPRSTSPSPYTRARRATSGLPYSSHPIYNLRRALICIDIFGALCGIAATSQYYMYPELLGANLILLAVSALFGIWDLFKYAKKKARDPEHDPEWPSKLVMSADAALAFLLLGLFVVMFSSPGSYYDPGEKIWIAWADLAALLASLLHFYCFWKQLMARCRVKWLRKLPHGPCERCGFSVPAAEVTQDHLPFRSNDRDRQAEQARTAPHPEPNLCTYVGPSADTQDGSVLTPQTTESAMEEGLLIGSGFGEGYGSIETSNHDEETVVEEPKEVIVQKAKRKKGTPAEAGPSEKALGKRAMP